MPPFRFEIVEVAKTTTVKEELPPPTWPAQDNRNGTRTKSALRHREYPPSVALDGRPRFSIVLADRVSLP